MEWQQLARNPASLWRNAVVWSYAMSALWMLVATMLFGKWGLILILGQSVVAILKLEWVNYLQHYGIEP